LCDCRWRGTRCLSGATPAVLGSRSPGLALQLQQSAFNEQIVFDVREALDETREFWMLRYNAAHLSQAPVFDMGIGFYDNLLGVAKFVDPESHIFNNQYKYEIFALYRAARDVICELQKSYV
jgi:hypothetical protein